MIDTIEKTCLAVPASASKMPDRNENYLINTIRYMIPAGARRGIIPIYLVGILVNPLLSGIEYLEELRFAVFSTDEYKKASEPKFARKEYGGQP
jgi:predicted membrane protein